MVIIYIASTCTMECIQFLPQVYQYGLQVVPVWFTGYTKVVHYLCLWDRQVYQYRLQLWSWCARGSSLQYKLAVWPFSPGGSEQFKDKRQFFFKELKSHHSKHHRSEVHIQVNRFNLLQSVRSTYSTIPSLMHTVVCVLQWSLCIQAMQATKGFSTSDWCKSFVVEFRGEEALDWGGVSRELFQLLCTSCFNCTNGMFRRFKDSPQALVSSQNTYMYMYNTTT